MKDKAFQDAFDKVLPETEKVLRRHSSDTPKPGDSSGLLAGRNSSDLYVCAGFCHGMSHADRFDFNEFERKILTAAGEILKVVADEMKPNRKDEVR